MTVTSHRAAHSMYAEGWGFSGPSWNSACNTTSVTLDTLCTSELSLLWLSDGKGNSHLSRKDLVGLNEILCGKSGARPEASGRQEGPR